MQTVYQFNASTDAKAIPKYIRAKMNGTWGAWTNVTVAKAVPSNANFSNTTYSTGTSSALGLTKLYTGTGTATDGTITQKEITEQLNKTAKIMDGNTSNMYTWSGEYIANNYLMYSDTAAAAKKIKDSYDNQDITISYMDTELTSSRWFAAWDGRKLGTISPHNLRASINAAMYYKITPEGDNRGVATTPNTYSNEFSFKGLKQGSTIGLGNATYAYLFGLRGWAESSGGKSHELAFNDNGIWTRRGATTSWEAWQKLITSHDATFSTSVRFNDTFIKKASGVRSCCVNLYANPDRLEFFWSGTAGGEDWTWSNKSYISADGQIYAAKQLSAAGHRITPYSDNGVSIIRPDGAQFSGLEVKELWIGPYSGATKRLSMSSSAPSSPGTGDVWIQN
jgi:hypothetical protein